MTINKNVSGVVGFVLYCTVLSCDLGAMEPTESGSDTRKVAKTPHEVAMESEQVGSPNEGDCQGLPKPSKEESCRPWRDFCFKTVSGFGVFCKIDIDEDGKESTKDFYRYAEEETKKDISSLKTKGYSFDIKKTLRENAKMIGFPSFYEIDTESFHVLTKK